MLDFRKASVRRTALMIAALTAVNLTILLIAGYGTLHWMESPSFCGLVCHTPMRPQYSAWQDAPHSRVNCTQCHIGEGARAFVHYKLVGVRQLYHVMTNQIPKPIPGVADMRPALEICGNCHWPERGSSDRVNVIREFADDESNTETTNGAANARRRTWTADGPAARFTGTRTRASTSPTWRPTGTGRPFPTSR